MIIGKVITESKNINSCVHAKGIFLPIPHLPEPFDRARQLATVKIKWDDLKSEIIML